MVNMIKKINKHNIDTNNEKDIKKQLKDLMFITSLFDDCLCCLFNCEYCKSEFNKIVLPKRDGDIKFESLDELYKNYINKSFDIIKQIKYKNEHYILVG